MRPLLRPRPAALFGLGALAALATGATALRGAAPPPTVHEVRMVMEGASARFEPARLTIRAGDRVRFVTVSGAPHNVAFSAEGLSPAARRALAAGMPDTIAPLAGPLVLEPNAPYTVDFAGVPAGTYPFVCMPHVAMGMTGSVTVR